MNGTLINQKLESVQNVSLLIGIEKKCTKCGNPKPFKDFYTRKDTKDKRYSWCKECCKKLAFFYRKINPEYAKKYAQQRRKTHPEKVKENYQRWYKANPEKIKERSRRWEKANPEKVKERKRCWERTNLEKRRKYARQSSKKRRNIPKGNLSCRMSKAIGTALRKNKAGRHWETLVDYTVDQLKRHLEKQFIEGMTWECFLKGEIHIDHIIPISKFNYENSGDLDFKRCWELKNLQPLWAKDNMTKGIKLTKNFQRGLLL